MREACFHAAGLTKGMSILEIGCGTGVVTRGLARIAGLNGRVVGLDVSPDGKWLYFTVAGDDAVQVLDTATRQVAGRIPVGASPHHAPFTLDGRWALVPGQGPGGHLGADAGGVPHADGEADGHPREHASRGRARLSTAAGSIVQDTQDVRPISTHRCPLLKAAG